MALFDIAHISDKQKARFWEHVDISGGNDCWPWKMGTSKEGYGKVSFYVLGVKYHLYSHRVALMLTEDRPQGWCLHSCDNPPCCNPKHLRWGDAMDNAADCIERERRPRGEANPAAKLTDDKVREMRRRYYANTVRALAREYGLDRVTVKRALTTGWRHIPKTP